MTQQASADLAEQKPTPTGLTASERKEWQDPELSFVEPKLTRHGELKELTGGFFGSFQP